MHLPARFKRKRASSSYERLWTQKEVLARTLFLGCAVCKQFSFDDMLIGFPYNYASRLFLSPSQLNGKKFENVKLKKWSSTFYWASGFDTTKIYSKAPIKPDSNISFLILAI